MSCVLLRHAAATDAEMTFAWRNDPGTRAMFRSTCAVTWAEHLRWFERRRADRAAPYWIGECDGRPVGTVRLDSRAMGEAEVSITVAPEARGRGVGRAILSSLCDRARADGWRVLHAEVKTDNPASRRIFESCGFSRVGGDDRMHRLALVLDRAP